MFGPSMLVGGMIGGFYGQLTDWLVPAAHINPAAYVLVGMGGFFAGVSKTPLTSIVIVSEMTGSYSLLVPLMLACGLNMAISRRWTIYEEQVASPIDSPAHQGDFVVDVLDRIFVSDVAVRTEGIEPIPASMPFKDLIPVRPLDSDPLSGGRRQRSSYRHLHTPRPSPGPRGIRSGARWFWPMTWPPSRSSRSLPTTRSTRLCGG